MISTDTSMIPFPVLYASLSNRNSTCRAPAGTASAITAPRRGGSVIERVFFDVLRSLTGGGDSRRGGGGAKFEPQSGSDR